jgi:tetratricopeptide (TPR) repeat protein
VNRHATTDRPDWAGRLWYSFYERGADMRDFCVVALAYITGQTPDALRQRPAHDLAHDLLTRLRARPFLLVLDGLERVLIAYHRSDAAQITDEAVDTAAPALGRQPRDCIRPDDDDLLRQFCAAGPSKILITSRLLPAALTNRVGPLPGVRHESLRGLDQPDAVLILAKAGIKGDGDAIGRYLEQQFGCHPLVVGIVAGLVANWPQAPGDFGRWVNAPDGGASVNLADPGIVQRRTHILKLAFDGLEPMARALMARIAMIANAVAREVVEALNPAMPAPPKVVRDPGALDVEGDSQIWRLRRRFSDAKTPERCADRERQIQERQAALSRRHEAARQAHAAYQTALAAWRSSEAVREARRWLNATLTDLSARGLLQWDKGENTYDLHPVVHGYAVGMLDGDARTSAGQHVADYFNARPRPAYRDARDRRDLDNAIQVVRALNLAGRVKEAWNVLNGDLRVALHRLELHHEWLSLMQPLFPDGWSAPPAGVEDLGLVASAVAAVLTQIGSRRDAAAQAVFAIRDAIRAGPSAELSVRLRNHSATLRATNDLPGRERLLVLDRRVATAAGDAQQALWCDVFQALDLTGQGRLTEARDVWTRLTPALPDAMRRQGQFEAQARYTEASLLFREGSLTQDHLHTALDRTRALGWHDVERWLHALAGAWHQSQGRHTESVAAFTTAIEMAHAVALRDTGSEARRGLSLSRLGRTREARDAAARAERDPPHAALASLYLALDQHDQARDHAREGYERAGANGPPYVWHWDLEECRTVLRALGEPEPVLPQYDPAGHPPFAWEVDIERMLAEHAAKQQAKDP